MIFNWKRWLEIMGLIFAIIIIDLALRFTIAQGIPSDILAFAYGVLVIALIASPIFDFLMFRKKLAALYPELKHRALEAARKKRGVVDKSELGKMPLEWHPWFVKKLNVDGLAEWDPRDKNRVLFPEIIAETHTEDEIMEMNLPISVGSKILRMKEKKSEKFEE